MTSARILVVEDEIITAKNLQNKLRNLGYTVPAIAFSGEEAIAKAIDIRPDLVLMDIRLPYEDGYGALQKIRSSPSLKNTKVVAVTAEASPEQMEKSKKSGFDGFIGKPLDPDHFPEQIKAILSGQEIWEFE